jgi:hypothetical protein
MKKCNAFIIVILLSFNNSLMTQVPSWEWIRSPEGRAISRSITTTSTGDVFICGGFYSNLIFDSTITLTNAGFGDMFIARYNEVGQVTWAKRATGNYGDEAQCIVNGNSGNVYVSGEFFSNDITFDSLTLINNKITPYFDDATKDIFIVKYNEEGKVIWAKSGGGINMEFVRSITVDSREKITIVGTFWSASVTFGPYTLTKTGNIDVFIVQYDSSGQVLWAKNPTGNDEENAYSIAADEAGNVYMAGSFRSDSIRFDDITLICCSDWFDTYIVEYDPQGKAIWAENATGNDWDEAQSVTLDKSGNIYLTGHFKSDTICFGAIALPKSPANNIDMFLVKYDSNHQVEWARRSGGNLWSWVYPADVVVDPFDNIWITGEFIGDGLEFGSISLPNNGSYDIYLVQYDKNGNVLWAEVVGGDGMDWGKGITQDYSGHGYLNGYFESSSIIFSDTILTNPTSQNKLFVAKKEKLTTLRDPIKQEIVTSDYRLSNYPNPFNPSTTIMFSTLNRSKIEIIIYDIFGKKIKTIFSDIINKGLHYTTWNGTNQDGVSVASGIYFYTFVATDIYVSHEMFKKSEKLLLLR